MYRRIYRGCIAAVLALSLVTLSVPAPAFADDLQFDPRLADSPISDIWSQADGDTFRDRGDSSWIWGPRIRSVTYEPYADSPNGRRQVFYFDKARMEINDPGKSQDSIWYASSGLLIREMMLGRIQIGDNRAIQTASAEIPVTGDMQNNPLSPTYATLAQHTSIGEGNVHRRAEPRVGQPVTAKLHADGSVDDNAIGDSDVEIAEYEDTLGHNIPDVFRDWMNDQSIPWEYIVGVPLTEPYWVDTMLNGEQRLVMVQAFERRILTYTPDNPDGWKVEAGNAGRHYRTWRGLDMTDDGSLQALAHGVTYGEIIVSAATEFGVDPYLLAGIADAASGFDPLARLEDNRVGLMGAPLDMMQERGMQHPFDPTVNVRFAAELLAQFHSEHGNWEDAVSEYFDPTPDDTLRALSLPEDSEDLATKSVESRSSIEGEYGGQTSPFDVEPYVEEVEEPDAEGPDPELRWIGSGPAAYYSSGYSVSWFANTLARHASWGNAVPGWAPDPNGYYCVHPDFRPGQRLQLTSSQGVTLSCTIGDSVASHHVQQWRSRWAIELSWNTYVDLGLLNGNYVEVRAH